MHIHWLTNQQYDPQKILGSNLASLRLRLGSLLFKAPTSIKISTGPKPHKKAGLLVISKIGAQSGAQEQDRWLEEISSFSNQNKPAILDYTDDHLAFESPMLDFYQKALEAASHFTTSSEELKISLQTRTSKNVFVIPDAIEARRTPPTDREKGVLWFGHSSNISYLLEHIPRLPKTSKKLILLTNSITEIQQNEINKKLPREISLFSGIWSKELMEKASLELSACIIPSDPSDPRKRGASENRLLTSLQLGLATAASPIPSYLRYGQYFLDLEKFSFDSVIESPSEWHDRISIAQKEIIPNFSQSKIANRWIKTLKDVQ
jgi:hypothetical protein